jgi:hypothetical protein
MEASRPGRAALLALAGFVGGAGVAVLYARGMRRAQRLNALAKIHEKDVRKVLSGTWLQWKVHAGVKQQLRIIAERRFFDNQQQHRLKCLLTLCMRRWLNSFRLSASVNA